MIADLTDHNAFAYVEIPNNHRAICCLLRYVLLKLVINFQNYSTIADLILKALFWKMTRFNSQLLFTAEEWLFQHSKFLLWDFFFFLFWIFVLYSSTHLALGRLKGVSVRKHHLREHKILHSTKKRCGGGGEKTSEALQKYLFGLCSTALKLFSSFEPLKSVTCWQLFTWNVSFVWFETAETITPKWGDYNTERNISMYCTSSVSILMTSVDQLME